MPILSLPSLTIAYTAGLVSFFAGCIAPIVPVYMSFLAGTNTGKRHTNHVFTNSILFVAGFIGVFMLLGLTVNGIGHLIVPYQRIVTRIGGVVLILFGLHTSGIMRFKILFSEKKLSMHNLPTGTAWGSLLLGMVFGFSWTPCIGPVLASILFWAGSQQTALQAIVLMFTFSLGLATPFIILGFLFHHILGSLQVIKSINRFAPLFTTLTGIILIILGVMLVCGYANHLSSLMPKHFSELLSTVKL